MDDPVLNGFFIFLNGKTGLKWMLKWVLGGTDGVVNLCELYLELID